MYSNQYFGVRLPIPDGWYVASQETQERLHEAGEQLAAGDDTALKKILKSSRQLTFTLLSASAHEPGAPVDFNPNIILLAERVSHLPGIRSGEDYLFHAKKLLLRTAIPYEVRTDTYRCDLGSDTWHRIDLSIDIPGQPISQSQIAIKRGDFVLVLVLSGGGPEQMAMLEEVAGSVVLEDPEVH